VWVTRYLQNMHFSLFILLISTRSWQKWRLWFVNWSVYNSHIELCQISALFSLSISWLVQNPIQPKVLLTESISHLMLWHVALENVRSGLKEKSLKYTAMSQGKPRYVSDWAGKELENVVESKTSNTKCFDVVHCCWFPWVRGFAACLVERMRKKHEKLCF